MYAIAAVYFIFKVGMNQVIEDKTLRGILQVYSEIIVDELIVFYGNTFGIYNTDAGHIGNAGLANIPNLQSDHCYTITIDNKSLEFIFRVNYRVPVSGDGYFFLDDQVMFFVNTT